MILVMMSSTSALYLNREETLHNHYPRQLNCTASNYGYHEEYDEDIAGIEEELVRKVQEFGTEPGNIVSTAYYRIVT